MQSTGLLDSINAVRAIAVEYEQPVCMLVGLLGRNQAKPLDDSQVYGVRIVPKLLDAMDVDYIIVDSPGDVAKIAPAIDAAYARSRPVVILISRPVAVSMMRRDLALKRWRRCAAARSSFRRIRRHSNGNAFHRAL